MKMLITAVFFIGPGAAAADRQTPERQSNAPAEPCLLPTKEDVEAGGRGARVHPIFTISLQL